MKRILAFEGDQELAATLKAGLWRYGCTLEVVDDADLGLEKALTERPDLILLSIELPRTNGFMVCNRLKRHETLKAIPLIILSSQCTDETFQAHRKMRTRAEGYLRKPFTLEELVEQVRQLISLDGARRATASGASTAPPDSEQTEAMEPARLTDIYNSLDGAIDNIREDEGSSPASSDRLTLLPSPAAPSPAAPLPCGEHCLLVLWSPDAKHRGQIYCFPGVTERLEEGGEELAFLRVGRADDNDLTLDDPLLSPQHFRFERSAGGLLLRDLGSGAGSFVNDELVSCQELFGGEVIRAGDTVLLCLHGLAAEARFERVVQELSELDPTTRVLSARALREQLKELLETARQELTPLSLAAVAIDDLRQIIYRYGDRMAERVVQEVAAMLRNAAPRGVVGRDASDGFLVVLPGTSQKLAVGLVEGWRFEATVSEVILGGHSVTATLSAGVVQWRDDWTATDLIRRTYRLLWEAANAGGNRVLTRSAAEPRSSGS